MVIEDIKENVYKSEIILSKKIGVKRKKKSENNWVKCENVSSIEINQKQA